MIRPLTRPMAQLLAPTLLFVGAAACEAHRGTPASAPGPAAAAATPSTEPPCPGMTPPPSGAPAPLAGSGAQPLGATPGSARNDSTAPKTPERCMGLGAQRLCLEPGASGSCEVAAAKGQGSAASCSLEKGDTLCVYLGKRSQCTTAREASRCEVTAVGNVAHRTCNGTHNLLTMD